MPILHETKLVWQQSTIGPNECSLKPRSHYACMNWTERKFWTRANQGNVYIAHTVWNSRTMRPSLLWLQSCLWVHFVWPDPTQPLGRRLNQPRHCSKGAQPVPKVVYRSGCRGKHNSPPRDSNLSLLTSQSDALTTRPLRPGSTCSAQFMGVRT